MKGGREAPARLRAVSWATRVAFVKGAEQDAAGGER